MPLRKLHLNKLESNFGKSIPYLTLIVVTAVTIGLTYLFNSHARQTEELRFVTALIPISGALVGLLLFALLRFERKAIVELTKFAHELDEARLEIAALLEREKAARRQAELANIAKDEFMATISHEIKTPLNAISGWSRILESNDISDEMKKEALETINRNIKKQSRIINELLLYSSLSGQETFDNKKMCRASELVHEAVQTIRREAGNKKIHFEMVNNLENEELFCDRANVVIALKTLLDNAVKFTPTGGEISLRVENQDNSLKLNVRDNGRGITKELLPHIFQKFRQSDSSTTREFGGVGLGLTIVQKIIEQHGGSIKVRSAGKDRGTVIEAILPLAARSVQVSLQHPDYRSSEKEHY